MHALQERFQQQIQELARTANRLAELGYVTSQGGNLSMRVEEDALLITPTKVAKLDVRFEDICVITWGRSCSRPQAQAHGMALSYPHRATARTCEASSTPIAGTYRFRDCRAMPGKHLPEPVLE